MSSQSPKGASKPPPRTASEAIAEDVRAQIATGRLEPGDMLPSESTLVGLYGVGTPTMRGALRILESDGLVRIQRGLKGGARVSIPDLAPLARRVGLHLQLRGTVLSELVQAQVIIQPGAVALACSVRTKDDLARLRGRARRVAGCETVDEFLNRVSAFTDAILRASHNRALALYSELTAALWREVVEAYVSDKGITAHEIRDRFPWFAKQYETVTDLIEQRDSEQAEQFWREHMRLADAMALAHRSPLLVYTEGTGEA